VTVRFLLVARNAGRVSVVGDFNGWNPGSTPMRRANDGQSWIAEVPLAPGRHVYAFVVDGDVVTDPAAPVAAEEDFGVRNSVVLVSGGGT
jgi:1,4-alpha-glucan branching enzyme